MPLVAPDRILWMAGTLLVGIADPRALVGSALRAGIKLCSAGTLDGDTPVESRLCSGAIFEFGMRFVA